MMSKIVIVMFEQRDCRFGSRAWGYTCLRFQILWYPVEAAAGLTTHRPRNTFECHKELLKNRSETE
jgi:hypothetical protein